MKTFQFMIDKFHQIGRITWEAESIEAQGATVEAAEESIKNQVPAGHRICIRLEITPEIRAHIEEMKKRPCI